MSLLPNIPAWSKLRKIVIGMVHLRPLPGSPRFGGDVAAIRAAMLADAQALVEGGVHGVMLENFGDVPFYPGAVPSHVVAQVTALAAELRDKLPGAGVPLGINLLRNDGCGALGIAHAVGAQFIRVNVLCGARVTDQGIVQGIAHDLMRLRRQLGAEQVAVLADVNVKHSAPIGPVRVEDEVADVTHRGLADGVIVTGAGTGKSTPLDEVRVVRSVTSGPIFVGSGVSVEACVSSCRWLTGSSSARR
jgi:hypothetical protein